MESLAGDRRMNTGQVIGGRDGARRLENVRG